MGDVISEIFYTKTTYNSFGFSQGNIIHYRLGFNNVEKFCRYMELDNYYVKLCGVPDRISYENGRLYVDELKTTITGKDNYIKSVGLAQLQLYMYITGISEGRLFIYYKDKGTLSLDTILQYDENKVKDILIKYITILEMKERFKKTYNQ